MSGTNFDFLKPITADPNYNNLVVQNVTGYNDLMAKYAAAKAYQQSTDPTTGQVDPNKFNALITQDPRSAWNAGPIMQQQGQAQAAQGQGVQEQVAAHRARMSVMMGLMNGLVSSGKPISQSDISDALNQAHLSPAEAQTITQDANTTSGGNPNFDFTNWVKGHMTANLTAQEQIARVTPNMQFLSTPNGIIAVDTNPNTTKTPPGSTQTFGLAPSTTTMVPDGKGGFVPGYLGPNAPAGFTPPGGAPAGGAGGGGGGAPTGAPLTPFVGANLPQGVTPAEDQEVRTVIGEAGNQPLQGQQGVAAVIKNRMAAGNQSAQDVIFAPNQFEPWNNPKVRAGLETIDPNSAQYQSVLNNVVRPVMSGQAQDPTGGATYFYSPTAQAALGRNAPSWAQGVTPSTVIGQHNFYNLPYGGAATTQAGRNAPQSGPLIIGDSIASAEGLGGTGVVSAQPGAVLTSIKNGVKNGAYEGKPVVLSSGASNGPGAIDTVEKQLQALQTGDAGKITLLGVGPAVEAKAPGTNAKLQALAQKYGAQFVPLPANAMSPDGVHPTAQGYVALRTAIGGQQPGTPYQVASNAPTAPPGTAPAPGPVTQTPLPPPAPAAAPAAFRYPNGKVGGAPDANGGVQYADGSYGTPPAGPRVPIAAPAAAPPARPAPAPAATAPVVAPPAAPAAAPQAGTPPGFVPSGPPLGTAEAIKARVDADAEKWRVSGAQYAADNAAAGQYNQRLWPLVNAEHILETQGTTTGQGAEAARSVISHLQTLASIFTPADLQTLGQAKFEEANKYLTQAVNAQPFAQASDARLASAITGNPSAHISTMANVQILKAMIGLERMKQMALTDFTNQGGNPSDYADFLRNWQTTHDPRAFIFDMLSDPERRKMVDSMTTPTERANYQNTLNLIKANPGILTRAAMP